MEDQIFMKFETYAYNRVVDHQKNVGKDLCTNARARNKNLRVHVKIHDKMFAHIFMPRMHMFLHKTLRKLY